ncbi:hypothetical protein M8494_30180 [Serratia ureilytica]
MNNIRKSPAAGLPARARRHPLPLPPLFYQTREMLAEEMAAAGGAAPAPSR